MATILTHDDRHSPAWGKLRRFLEAELESLRRHNDKARPEADTAWTRGEIAMAKKILALGVDQKKPTKESSDGNA